MILVPLAFLLGFALLLLVLGYYPADGGSDSRAKGAAAGRSARAPVPGFFASALDRSAVVPSQGPDEEVLLGLQRYLEIEQTLANEFVSQPSVETLYRGSGSRFSFKRLALPGGKPPAGLLSD